MPKKVSKPAKAVNATKAAKPATAAKAANSSKAVAGVNAAKARKAAKPETGDVLGLRTLNRALLQRQMLLQRARMPAIDAIEHLVGVQAQEPKSPYVGLWTRLEHFRPEELETLLTTRQAVRIIVMRGTIHLISARDCALMRPLTQPIMDRVKQSQEVRTHLGDVDLAKLASAARRLLEQKPRTVAEVSKMLLEKWPGRDLFAINLAVRAMLPLVQCPPRGLWNDNGQVVCATAEQWLDRPLESKVLADEIILRYLAAFGPATCADMSSWSGLSRLQETVERLRPRLRVFRNEAGKELFDLPDAPRPDPDTPAPARFLPEFDNALLAFADRSRIVAHERRNVSVAGHRVLLIDGFTRATWRIDRKDPAKKRDASTNTATLVIEPFAALSKTDAAAATAEGHRLMKFAAHDAAAHDVRVTAPV